MIRKVGDYIYEVPSNTDYGKNYLVVCNPGEDVSCTCTGYATKRNAVNAGRPDRHPTRVFGRMQPGFCRHIAALEASGVEVAPDQRRIRDKAEAQRRLENQQRKIVEDLRDMMKELEEL